MSKNHIKHIHDDALSICGETLTNEFYFKTIEQAVLNGIHANNVIACGLCTELVCNHLKAGTFENNSNEV